MQRVRGGLELVRRGRACGAPYVRWFAAQPEAAEDDGMIEVLVDGNAVRVPRGVNVLQACEAGGVDIPRYVWILSVGICGLGWGLLAVVPGRKPKFCPPRHNTAASWRLAHSLAHSITHSHDE